jgi:broad specificity phosphatase PhoE
VGQILLVRHGQASWDGDDYDVLSEKGHEQSRVLGTTLAARGIRPEVVVSGGMRRHRETIDNVLDGAGWSHLEVEVDSGWDEYDHVSMLAQVPTKFAGERPTAAEFQAWLEKAAERWTGGENDEDYHEPFGDFAGRVDDALKRAVDAATGTVLVVTSGGPISWATAGLLDGGAQLWSRLNVVCVNTGVTKVVTGRRGATLVSFNEHTHLDAVPGLLTYR